MTCYSGKDGSLKFDGASIGRVRNWSLNSTLETLDTTSLGDGANVYCAGLRTATGTATIWYHSDNNIGTVLEECMRTDKPTPATLELTWANKKVSFKAYVNSATITCNTGEVMSADVSFQMTGNYTGILL